jgi:hypothetical protein
MLFLQQNFRLTLLLLEVSISSILFQLVQIKIQSIKTNDQQQSMRHYTTIVLLLFITVQTIQAAITCGSFTCTGTSQCCSQNQIGLYSSVCYSPSTHSCTNNQFASLVSQQPNCLCAVSRPDCCCQGKCYDPVNYYCDPIACSTDKICQKGTARRIDFAVAADNYFALYLNDAPSPIVCSFGVSRDDGWKTALTGNFMARKGDVIRIIAQNDVTNGPPSSENPGMIAGEFNVVTGLRFVTDGSWSCTSGYVLNPYSVQTGTCGTGPSTLSGWNSAYIYGDVGSVPETSPWIKYTSPPHYLGLTNSPTKAQYIWDDDVNAELVTCIKRLTTLNP